MADSTPKAPAASPPHAGAPPAWGGPAQAGGARLLVADDNKVNRLLLGRGLELQGHRVAMAENGRVALEMLAREPFDLLVLDIEMPEMSGFEVLRSNLPSTPAVNWYTDSVAGTPQKFWRITTEP